MDGLLFFLILDCTEANDGELGKEVAGEVVKVGELLWITTGEVLFSTGVSLNLSNKSQILLSRLLTCKPVLLLKGDNISSGARLRIAIVQGFEEEDKSLSFVVVVVVDEGGEDEV